ncbi:MAG: energy-coupling factor transporter ATPase [Desulfocucumaceae bacterium]
MTYRYGGTAGSALDGITTTVRRGQFTAVIGPNGSGKSTLARHMNALLLPSSGTVTVDGMDPAIPGNIPEIRRRVGFVFQNPDNQLVGTTVEEDIAFGPENLGRDPASIRDAVDFALEATGLGELAGRPPHMLSGGQKQLLAIAGALAMKTGCLILDEPTSMLGPSGRRSVMNIVRRLKKDLKITVVLVTHLMEEAVLADRVLVLHRGRVAAEGTPAEVFSSGSPLPGIGLELPGPVELAGRLRQYGVELPDPVLTVDELVACLCRL